VAEPDHRACAKAGIGALQRWYAPALDALIAAAALSAR
jgi:hypothetical protein